MNLSPVIIIKNRKIYRRDNVQMGVLGLVSHGLEEKKRYVVKNTYMIIIRILSIIITISNTY